MLDMSSICNCVGPEGNYGLTCPSHEKAKLLREAHSSDQ